MNLTGQAPYQKQPKATKSNRPTAEQKRFWAKLRTLGCIICKSPPSIHHCETGQGGRKDHDLVIPLCHYHHQGEQGIHTLGRRVWQAIFGTEQELMEKAWGMI